MSEQTAPYIGVLSLERGTATAQLPPQPPGSMRRPDTFGLPAIFETVEGAWVDNVVRGDPALEAPYVAAARRLATRGAVVITSNCGFSIRHQDAVSAAVQVPVGMSSLLLLPTLLRVMPKAAQIAILTFDSDCFTDDLFDGIAPSDRRRILIGGVEGGTFWKNEMERPPIFTDPALIIEDVLALARSLRAESPAIAIYLLECCSFPLAASALRNAEGLPVYDISDLGRALIRSVHKDPVSQGS